MVHLTWLVASTLRSSNRSRWDTGYRILYKLTKYVYYYSIKGILIPTKILFPKQDSKGILFSQAEIVELFQSKKPKSDRPYGPMGKGKLDDASENTVPKDILSTEMMTGEAAPRPL